MRTSILLLALSAVVLGGCSSAYKTGQTPDDVYYSPQRPQDEYVNIKDNDEGHYYANDDNYSDQYLRMKVRNRLIWSELDDYYYNPGFSYSYYNRWNWNNPWSPYTYWNYYYNPYCSPLIFTSKSNIAYNHPRIFNLNSYNNNQLTNRNYTNPKGGMYGNGVNSSNYNAPVRVIGVNSSKSRINSNTGNFLRNIFNGSPSNNNNNNNSSFSNPGRSSSSSSSSSSGSSGSGGSAPVRKF